MKKTALIIMFITLISKFLGFGRDIFLSYYFGASKISDIYIISQTVPSVIFGIIGVGIATAYIPMQSRISENLGEEEAYRFTSNFTNIIIVIVTFILIIGVAYTEEIVRFFALGFSGETLRITTVFTRISLFGMYFSALISIFSGYLQIKKNFVIPAIIGIPLNLIIMISIFFASKGNYVILAIGTLIASGSQFVLMLPFIFKEKFRYKCIIDLKDENIKKTMLISLPIIIGASVNQINVLVDRTIASTIAIGGISALNYANKLNLFIQGLVVTSIVTVIYPLLSSYASKDNIDGVKKIILEAVNIIAILVLPIMIGTMVFSNQVVDLLFGRGAFDETAIKMTSLALFFYSFGMLGFGLREVISRGFYSLQDTKTPMINAAFGMFVNIVLNFILSRYLGIGGLALATSISATLTTILLFISLRMKIGAFGLKQISVSLAKILIASLIMGFISKMSFSYLVLISSQNISLLFSVGLGALSYFIIIYFMKIDNVDIFVLSIKRKFSSFLH